MNNRTLSVVVLLGAFTPAMMLLISRQHIAAAEETPVKLGHPVKAEDARDAEAFEGLWYGSWGGGDVNGVVFQPVVAELFIQADHAELSGFPNANTISGTIQVDARAKRVQITPATKTDGQELEAVKYAYRLKDGNLTLIDAGHISVTLEKYVVVQDPLANAAVEFVAATGINDAGDLLVTEFTMLRAGRAGTAYFRPSSRPLTTRQAAVFLVKDAGMKEVTIAEARGLIRGATPVVVAYRHDNDLLRRGHHRLWSDVGKPIPDSELVLRTYSRVLRPGTLVFILSARENTVVP